MKQSLIAICLFAFFTIICNAEVNYTRPSGLQSIENGSIYSIYQDGLGALWMNTNYGICRYNGHSLEFVHDPLPISMIIGNGNDRFYIPAVTCILQFDRIGDFLRRIDHWNTSHSQCYHKSSICTVKRIIQSQRRVPCSIVVICRETHTRLSFTE